MSRPRQEILDRLRAIQKKQDAEEYHSYFDDCLEEKLRELDPEWVEAMLAEYENSKVCRWYA